MIKFLKDLFVIILNILKSRYKWMAILYLLWLFRVDFIVADSGGMAKGLQVITIFGLLYYVINKFPHAVSYSYGSTNIATRSILWFYTFAVLSTLWAFIPTFAFFLSFQNIVLIFALVWMFRLVDSFNSMERIFLLFAIATTLFEVIIIRFYEPSIFIHFLPGGSAAAICISYCAGELMVKRKIDKSRKKLLYNVLIISIIILITSTSSGANVSAILGCCIALFFSGNILWACLIIFIGIFLYLNQDMIMQFLLLVMPGKTEAVIESGNGRDTIWDGILAVTGQRPLIGWGYACGERVASKYLNWVLSDAHNNYLGIYGGLGWIGIIMFVFHQFISLRTAFIKRIKVGYTGLFCGLCCATINGYSYGYLSGKACSITVIYFAMIILTFSYSKVQKI